MSDNRPNVSVVIPAYGPCPHLPRVIAAIRAGQVQPVEIIVSHSGAGHPGDTLPDDVILLHSPTRLFAGAARNVGAKSATGELLAFCDADVVPDPDWLATLTEALTARPGTFAVGSVGVAERAGYWGMSTWISEFSEQAPWHPARQQAGGASCNMAVRADDFRAIGGFRDDQRAGEDTVLFHGLRSAGHAQWFVPEARVDHINIPGFAHFRRHQWQLGYNAGRTRTEHALRGSAAARYPVLALGLWVPRTWLILKRAAAKPGNGLGVALTYAPAILLGTLIWTAGFLAYVLRRRGGAEASSGAAHQ